MRFFIYFDSNAARAFASGEKPEKRSVREQNHSNAGANLRPGFMTCKAYERKPIGDFFKGLDFSFTPLAASYENHLTKKNKKSLNTKSRNSKQTPHLDQVKVAVVQSTVAVLVDGLSQNLVGRVVGGHQDGDVRPVRFQLLAINLQTAT